jgi:hypothetical protein
LPGALYGVAMAQCVYLYAPLQKCVKGSKKD